MMSHTIHKYCEYEYFPDFNEYVKRRVIKTYDEKGRIIRSMVEKWKIMTERQVEKLYLQFS